MIFTIVIEVILPQYSKTKRRAMDAAISIECNHMVTIDGVCIKYIMFKINKKQFTKLTFSGHSNIYFPNNVVIVHTCLRKFHVDGMQVIS